MAFLSIVVLSFCAVASIHGVAFTDLPGFEHFTGCKTNDCWHEAKDSVHKLFKTGYEPLGIPKIDPLHIGTVELTLPNAKIAVHDVELTGFDTIDDVKYEVDKENKVILHEATYDLTFKGHAERTFNLDKEYKFSTNTELHYPNVDVTIKRKFDLEKKPYNGKEETFLVPKDYELSYKFDGEPEVKYDQAYLDEIKNNEAVQKWFKEHEADVKKARKEHLDKYVKTFTDAMLGVYAKIDENFPVSQFMPQFRQ